jgi:histidine triad (HIT) family protein
VSADGPCPFCEIAAGRAPAVIVGEKHNRYHPDGDALAIVPLNPVTDGHLIVFPKVHVADARDSYAAGKVAEYAADIGASRYTSYNLITSVGAPATQTVRHLHWHVVPRRDGDGLHLPWTGQGGGR